MLIMMLSVLRATHINHCQIGLTLVPAGSQYVNITIYN